jgi:hypothetical protein
VLIAVNCVFFLSATSLNDAQLEDLLAQFALVPARYQEATDVADYLPFLTNIVPAWRLAASDPQHVDTVAVRSAD